MILITLLTSIAGPRRGRAETSATDPDAHRLHATEPGAAAPDHSSPCGTLPAPRRLDRPGSR
ncbi:hypothetical protein SAMN02799631_01351 [Methylobacterium sp. 174MFSha1.1]|nr:hypothetical protein SAMN02799631_01351 [Methylobacterium sp. 174MFSha1.1]